MYISVDFGGTSTRLAASKSLSVPEFIGEPVRRRNTRNYKNDLQFIIDTAKQLVGDQQIEAIGIGFAGRITADGRRVEFANNNKHWEGQPFAEALEVELGCRVYLDNDAVASGLGEAYYGDTPNEFVYLIWGTGIGGTLVQKTDVDTVESIKAIDWRNLLRAWEQDCGGRALTQKYGQSSRVLTDAQWSEVFGVFETHLVEFCRTAGPKNIVLAGGMGIRHAQRIIEIAKNNPALSSIHIKASIHGEDSGLYGGFGLIRHDQT